MSFLSRALPPTIRTLQILCGLHVFSEAVGEVLPCAGFSMLPTLSHDGDVVLVSAISYWRPAWLWNDAPSSTSTSPSPNSTPPGELKGVLARTRPRPQRGDVVVATSPLDPRQTVCKRVLGVAGDIVEIEPRRGNRTWSEQSSYAVDESFDGRRKRPGEGRHVRVPKGHVWLVGDNLSNSTDSRTYGPVPLAMVKGKVIARIWPRWTWMDSNPVRELGDSPTPPPAAPPPLTVLNT